MKKAILTMVIAVALYACGGGDTETTTTKPISNASTEETTAPVAEAPVVAKKDGKTLIEGSDCRTCHKDDTKLIGPSYQDVAKKYANNAENVKLLAGKIIKGGQGVWGEIPMSPHPNVTEDDAAAMVEYILSMNK
jgi:cytochrome c